MHFITLIVIPKKIFCVGLEHIIMYIHDKMKPYNEELEVAPYISLTKKQIEERFKTYQQSTYYDPKYDTLEKYEKDYLECMIDYQGNVLCSRNPHALWDGYVFGGSLSDKNFTIGEFKRFESYAINILYHDKVGGLLHFEKYDPLFDRIMECYSCPVQIFLNKFQTNKKEHLYRHIIDKNGLLYQQETDADLNIKFNDDHWIHIFEQILLDSKDDFIVSLDCHI
jgi:hypothetical protein